MKKALAFILASFVFASVFFKSIPTKASDFAIPNSGWLPVIYDIFYSLANGNELNIAELAGELTGISAAIDKYNELRTQKFVSPFEGLINMSMFAYGLSIPENDLYDLAAQYSIYLKDGTYPVLGKWDQAHTAYWNQYNTQYNDLYLSDFLQDNNVIEVNPDTSYLTQLQTIGSFTDAAFVYPIYESQPSGLISWNNRSNYSYYNPGTSFENRYTGTSATDMITCNVVTSGDNYIINFNSVSYVNCFYNGNYYNTAAGYFNSDPNHYIYIYTLSNRDILQTNPVQSVSFNTLQGAMDYLALHYRNINVFVDGVAWLLVGESDIEDVIIAPTVIRNPNGLIDSQDVYIPDQELAFDLIGLINLLDEALQNQDTVTFDDLITDGIIVNPDGTALNDARQHILQNTIQRIIADERERDDPEPIPTTTPPPYPTFPEVDWRKNPIPEPLPTGFDISNGNPADAFSGTSTLAQIVDATNRGLPSELVYTFWGIVFGMIVLGIIKVLHK